MRTTLLRPACSWCAPTTLARCTAAPAYTVELITAAGAPLPLHACAVHVGALLVRSFANPSISRASVHTVGARALTSVDESGSSPVTFRGC